LSYYVHNVPGRLRVRLPMVKNNPSKEEHVRSILRDVKGVETISVNPMTGSVVVNYDPEVLTYENILEILKEYNYFDESKMVNNDKYIEGAVTKAGEAVGKAVLSWAVGKAFEGSGLSILAAFI
jgi:copper chaperone CopZ